MSYTPYTEAARQDVERFLSLSLPVALLVRFGRTRPGLTLDDVVVEVSWVGDAAMIGVALAGSSPVETCLAVMDGRKEDFPTLVREQPAELLRSLCHDIEHLIGTQNAL